MIHEDVVSWENLPNDLKDLIIGDVTVQPVPNVYVNYNSLTSNFNVNPVYSCEVFIQAMKGTFMLDYLFRLFFT